MTPLQIYQTFQDLFDKVDSEATPQIHPEQVFTYFNVAVNELILEGRQAFEKTAKVRDDLSTLVKRGSIPSISTTPNFFPLSNAVNKSGIALNVLYVISATCDVTATHKGKDISGVSRVEFIQHDDENPVTVDPQQGNYLDVISAVVEDKGINVFLPTKYSPVAKAIKGVFFVAPAVVDANTQCDLPEQLHLSLVKRAVEIAYTSLLTTVAK